MKLQWLLSSLCVGLWTVGCATQPPPSWRAPEVALDTMADSDTQDACEDGQSQACHELAEKLEALETPTAEQYKAAFLLRARACVLDESPSCERLATHHLYGGTGVEIPNVRLAQAAMEASCLRDNGAHCHVAGFLHVDGIHKPENPKEGLVWLEKGCRVGYMKSCSMAGLIYQHGKGVDVDLKKAAELYDLGCEGGETEVACLNLALFLINGDLGEPDVARGTELMQRCCDGGLPLCCDNMDILNSAP